VKLRHSYKNDLQNNYNYITEEIRKELKIGSNILTLNFENFYCDKKNNDF